MTKGNGIVPDNVELSIKLGFNSEGKPVMGFYEKSNNRFIFQMSFTEVECIYCRDFFLQFGRK